MKTTKIISSDIALTLERFDGRMCYILVNVANVSTYLITSRCCYLYTCETMPQAALVRSHLKTGFVA